jgi:hypothetical protein
MKFFFTRECKDANEAKLIPVYDRAFYRYAKEHEHDPRLKQIVQEEWEQEVKKKVKVNDL